MKNAMLEKIRKANPNPAPEPDNETLRVVNLPRMDYGALPDLTPSLALPGGRARLKPLQNAALHAIASCGGGYLPLGVGEGKTLIGLLAGTVLGVNRVLYVCPSTLREQVRANIKEWGQHFRLPPEFEVRSYDEISRDSDGNLSDWIGQGRALVVLDEAHRLKARTAARTKRFLRAVVEAGARVQYLVMSGTLLSAGIGDTVHLAEIALRDLSPIPRSTHHLRAWESWIDSGEPDASQARVLAPLVSAFGPSGGDWRTRCREAFRERLRSAPGVVMSREGAIGTSLRLYQVRLPMPAALTDAIEFAGDEAPNGIPTEDAVTAANLRDSLALGFYYEYVWPEGAPDYPWLDARRAWNRKVRGELEYRASPGYDSPALVAAHVDAEIYRGGATRGIHRARLDWLRESERRGEPPMRAVWLDDAPMRAVWATVSQLSVPFILWYDSLAVADWIADNTGIRVWRAGETPDTAPHNCAMSIRAHGTGLNLQGWSACVVLEPPASGATWEQLLGRTHRPGQTAEEVVWWTLAHTESFQGALAGALRNARFVEESQGTAQKLLFADKAVVRWGAT